MNLDQMKKELKSMVERKLMAYIKPANKDEILEIVIEGIENYFKNQKPEEKPIDESRIVKIDVDDETGDEIVTLKPEKTTEKPEKTVKQLKEQIKVMENKTKVHYELKEDGVYKIVGEKPHATDESIHDLANWIRLTRDSSKRYFWDLTLGHCSLWDKNNIEKQIKRTEEQINNLKILMEKLETRKSLL